MTSKRYALIMNPTAKSGKGKKKWDQILGFFNAEALDHEVMMSEHSGHAIKLAKDASESGFDVVVSIGGDGTINEVLKGIMSSDTDKKPALGILYTGTSPDVCKYHKIPLVMDKALAMMRELNTRAIDVGVVDYMKDGNPEKGFFLCSVNLGIGAKVADGSNSGLRKYLGDFLGTFCSIFLSFIQYRKDTFTCTIDGKKHIWDKVINITIGKNPYIASGLKVDVPVSYCDNQMYLLVMKKFNFLSLLFHIPKLYLGTFQNHPNNELHYLRELECFENEFENDVEFDGDPQGKLPCKIHLAHKGLNLVVP